MSDIAQAIAERLCVKFEGFYSTPYLCPAGVPTIGYGFTHYFDGTPVQLTDPPMPWAIARSLLRQFIERDYLPVSRRLCPGIETPEQLGAVTDFCFNLGARNLKASTLRRKINEGDWDEVPEQLRRWVRANGRVLRGLVLRREAEIGYV